MAPAILAKLQYGPITSVRIVIDSFVTLALTPKTTRMMTIIANRALENAALEGLFEHVGNVGNLNVVPARASQLSAGIVMEVWNVWIA